MGRSCADINAVPSNSLFSFHSYGFSKWSGNLALFVAIGGSKRFRRAERAEVSNLWGVPSPCENAEKTRSATPSPTSTETTPNPGTSAGAGVDAGAADATTVGRAVAGDGAVTCSSIVRFVFSTRVPVVL
ncbi:hypothetical protein ES707_01908 [subsurface metagenome]